VAAFRAAPGCLLEPLAGSVVDSIASARAMLAAVPGLRLAVDTGHVAGWGEDPLILLEHAGHVQLRQGGGGQPQLRLDDPAGTVDFAAVLGRLDAIGYDGALTIEYFDRPAFGMPFADCHGATVELARHVRGLMGD
jgi:sugar phosphate isomerase/epimerase